VAWACCKAAEVLHSRQLVYRDFRQANVVKHPANKGFMVIDLEGCTQLGHQSNTASFRAWDQGTLASPNHYNKQSDMYQVR
jgi:hypothetical protein